MLYKRRGRKMAEILMGNLALILFLKIFDYIASHFYGFAHDFYNNYLHKIELFKSFQ